MHKDRLALQFPGLYHESQQTGKKLKLLVANFKTWDRQFNALWDRLECKKAKPLPNKRYFSLQKELKPLLAWDNVRDMRSYWFAKPQDQRELAWRDLMMAVMRYHPGRAAQVLEATLEPRVTPHWAVADVFCFVVRRTSELPPQHRAAQQAALPGLLLYLLRSSSPRDFRLQQWVIGQILSDCEPDVVAEIYLELRRYMHPLHWNTKLKIAGRLTVASKHKLVALQLLEEVLKDGRVDVNDRRCAALATELLTLPPRWKLGRESPAEVQMLAEVFERIVSLGLSPNLITYTAMIRALCLTNQLDTAWKVYNSMRDQGVAMDPHIFSIMLNGAKTAGSLDSTIRIIEDAPAEVLHKSYTWNDLMHTIFLAATREARIQPNNREVAVPAFNSMLQVYAKFFKLGPLQALIPTNLYDQGSRPEVLDPWEWKEKMALLIDKLPVSPQSQLVEPGVDTLGIMLLGYINSFADPAPVMSFYSHFRHLLKNRNPIAVALASHSTFPYDVVLKAITGHHGMLRVSLDIVSDMIRDAAGSATAPKSPPEPQTIPSATKTTDPENHASAAGDGQGQPATAKRNPKKKFTNGAFHHPPPSVYTWSILLSAFARQRHPRYGARLIQVMRSHGIEPNRVTWNMLVSGYARVQDAPRVLAALSKLNQAGFHPDRYTVRGVGRLREPDAVLARLEQRAIERDAELDAERWKLVDEADRLRWRELLRERRRKKAGKPWRAAPTEKEEDVEDAAEQDEVVRMTRRQRQRERWKKAARKQWRKHWRRRVVNVAKRRKVQPELASRRMWTYPWLRGLAPRLQREGTAPESTSTATMGDIDGTLEDDMSAMNLDAALQMYEDHASKPKRRRRTSRKKRPKAGGQELNTPAVDKHSKSGAGEAGEAGPPQRADSEKDGSGGEPPKE